MTTAAHHLALARMCINDIVQGRSVDLRACAQTFRSVGADDCAELCETKRGLFFSWREVDRRLFIFKLGRRWSAFVQAANRREEKATMMRVCSKCRKLVNDKDKPVGEELTKEQQNGASHTYCVPCYEDLYGPLESPVPKRSSGSGGSDDNASYRSAMIDAGRGGLLR
jgi:ribosomal protein L28